jgi:hypothetical protein
VTRLTIVTAADRRYFRCLLQLLRSIGRNVPPADVRTVVYDLGFEAAQRTLLIRRFPAIDVRSFDFSRFPAFVRIRARAVNTNAWKPQAIAAVTAENDGVVLWLDSATVLTRYPESIVRFAERSGVYAAFGGRGTIGELTHPSALRALGADATIARLRQRGSGVLGFDARQERVRRLVCDWAAACLDPGIIDPPGATLANHRYDQSALNLLLARHPELEMTSDELDISSSRPVGVLRTRNKLSNAVPLWMDRPARAWFAARRAIDVAIWRIRDRRRAARLPM